MLMDRTLARHVVRAYKLSICTFERPCSHASIAVSVSFHSSLCIGRTCTTSWMFLHGEFEQECCSSVFIPGIAMVVSSSVPEASKLKPQGESLVVHFAAHGGQHSPASHARANLIFFFFREPLCPQPALSTLFFTSLSGAFSNKLAVLLFKLAIVSSVVLPFSFSSRLTRTTTAAAPTLIAKMGSMAREMRYDI